MAVSSQSLKRMGVGKEPWERVFAMNSVHITYSAQTRISYIFLLGRKNPHSSSTAA